MWGKNHFIPDLTAGMSSELSGQVSWCIQTSSKCGFSLIAGGRIWSFQALLEGFLAVLACSTL